MRARVPRHKIAWRRGGGRRETETRRRRGGRRGKGLDLELVSNPVHFVLKFAKRVIFVVFYGSCCRLIPLLHRMQRRCTYSSASSAQLPQPASALPADLCDARPSKIDTTLK
jgi:hypothetical protein